MMRLLLPSLLCACFSLAQPALAAPKKGKRLAAADSASCTVRTIHGLQKAGGIDKRLAFLRKQLSKPPFSAYKSIKLLGANSLAIPQSTAKTVKLPNAKVLTLRFKEKLLVKGRVRLRMHLGILEPKTKKYSTRTLFSIADGGTLLVAGASYQGGTLIIGLTCKGK